MISVCAGLVVVDDKSKIIRLVHYTTQEYFERTRDDWFPDAETFITTICVTYLSFETFNTGFCLTLRDFVDRVRSNRLSTYAASFWRLHIGKASISEKTLEHALLRFLENQAKVDTSWQLRDSHDLLESHVGQGSSLNSSYSYYSHSRFSSTGLTGMHITAFFGLKTVVQLLLYSGKLEVDSRDSPSKRVFSRDVDIVNQGQTPLFYAAQNGHEKVMKLLLDTGKVEINSRDRFRQTPLLYAVKSGHEKAVKLLLDTGKVEVNSKNYRGRTPFGKTQLFGAVDNGHESIVRLLLNTGAVNINQSDYEHRTPISYAAESGFESMVKLFLDTNSVDSDVADKSGRTPISYAAEGGHESIVKLFLNTNSVDVNSADKYHRTPIFYAAQSGSESMVKLLLDTGKIIGDQNHNGFTLFRHACRQKSRSIIELLLDTGEFNYNSVDDGGLTPLWRAAFEAIEAVLEQFLNTKKVDLNCAMKYWKNEESSFHVHEGIVKLLVKAYADTKIDIPPIAAEYIRERWPDILEGT
ncbi:hypothetical protein BPAE_0079g00230 [Botrytis paeoniae]|uniref:Uncharacterized protein n=1 Tax=Botrytis paeoniae TaxID=278948 RepID=A0A4Z1FLD7_9HELO|nr:hypothetical protein BPAE_0079g00230 [Botrytis paeoniae]